MTTAKILFVDVVILPVIYSLISLIRRNIKNGRFITLLSKRGLTRDRRHFATSYQAGISSRPANGARQSDQHDVLSSCIINVPGTFVVKQLTQEKLQNKGRLLGFLSPR